MINSAKALASSEVDDALLGLQACQVDTIKLKLESAEKQHRVGRIADAGASSGFVLWAECLPS